MKLHLKPRVIHGTPVTPKRLLEEMRGESFCVSFADPRDLERCMKIVDKNGMLMLDNGAFTIWRSGKGKVDERAFFSWANSVMDVCDVAVACIPDIIEGSEEENWTAAARAVREYAKYPERLMFVWHMNDSLETLLKACRLFNFVAIGSCAEYDVAKKRAAYLERLKEVNAVADSVECLYGRRPWLHLMRGLAVLPEVVRFNSADSSNIARNHCAYKASGPGHVRRFANRIRAAVAKASAKAAVGPAFETSNFGS